jgi:hypothetical protein
MTLPLLRSLYDAIEEIEKAPDVNIRGVRKILSDEVLSLGREEEHIYNVVLSYVKLIDRVVEDHRENSFDNQVGSLSRLKDIYNKEAHNSK